MIEKNISFLNRITWIKIFYILRYYWLNNIEVIIKIKSIWSRRIILWCSINLHFFEFMKTIWSIFRIIIGHLRNLFYFSKMYTYRFIDYLEEFSISYLSDIIVSLCISYHLYHTFLYSISSVSFEILNDKYIMMKIVFFEDHDIFYQDNNHSTIDTFQISKVICISNISFIIIRYIDYIHKIIMFIW